MPPTPSLEKDESILGLVSGLATALDPTNWQIVDHWEADLLAIGIASTAQPKLLVYVSTRNQPPGTYFYECESPPLTGDDGPYRRGTSSDGVSFSDLAAVIETHLALPPRPTRP